MTQFVQAATVDPAVKALMENVLSTLSGGNGGGAVPSAVAGSVSVAEYGAGALRSTVFTFNNLPMTVRDTQQGNGVKVYTFPKGKIIRLGASLDATITTTSDPTTTLNASVTGNMGVGSTTQANGTLATTEQDFVQTTNFTASATQNTPNTLVHAYGAANLTVLDGSGTAIALFFNIGVATATDIDGDATVLINGTLTVNWINT